MISLDTRIDLMGRLGEYMLSDAEQWQNAKRRANDANGWFTQENIDFAIKNITTNFLDTKSLKQWADRYPIKEDAKTIGIIMAGNIPMVGFHDFLCGFISGHKLYIKLSSKDEVLMNHLIETLKAWEPSIKEYINTTELLKNCDAYIATGSNNSSRYFEQYFGKFPNIIRKNRTSVAILDGAESESDLYNLGMDIFNYFGLGCRNVTKVYLPEQYDLKQLFEAFSPFKDIINHHKYKNNFDYYLAIYLLNKVLYHTDDSLLLVENEQPFSAVSVLHYEYYKDKNDLLNSLQNDDRIQCIVGEGLIPFGESQKPSLNDYADGVDTMLFLNDL